MNDTTYKHALPAGHPRGAARQALGRRPKSLSAGYSPPERHGSAGEQRPRTDVHAPPALCRRASTGAAPVAAPRRQGMPPRRRQHPLPRLDVIAQ